MGLFIFGQNKRASHTRKTLNLHPLLCAYFTFYPLNDKIPVFSFFAQDKTTTESHSRHSILFHNTSCISILTYKDTLHFSPSFGSVVPSVPIFLMPTSAVSSAVLQPVSLYSALGFAGLSAGTKLLYAFFPEPVFFFFWHIHTIPFVFLGIVTEIEAVYQIRMITYLPKSMLLSILCVSDSK